MKKRAYSNRRVAGKLVLCTAVFTSAAAFAQIPIAPGLYEQDFAIMGTVSGVYPAGWNGWKIAGAGALPSGSFITTGTDPALLTSDGSTGVATGSIYNFGLSGNTNRTLGSIATSNTIGAFGASFENESGQLLTAAEVSVGFTARQWRSANNATVNETLAFQFKIGGSLNDLTGWTSLTSLNINEILIGSTVEGAVNGILAGNFSIAAPLPFIGLNWAPDEILHIRWRDADDTGFDAGMGVDDFKLLVIPEPATPLLVASTALLLGGVRRSRRSPAGR